MKDTLLLFTRSFPYGKGEEFLESEIIYLSKKFKQVYIYPNELNDAKRPLPDNCLVIPATIEFSPQKKLRHYVLKNLPEILRYYIYLLLKSKQRGYYLKN